ncbi:hypothetical protein GU926_14600 [Nibribacter ruber]|uniref:DUF7948 domain-containing protein n=1 Tax=Nibribacter ruber TaxID=2698458 RepID=A0A6P1P2J4_9BACT|nr:hypothetical protein [Nibribacter ruber]QHL88592.1 hypothetical protein GU926_14600 [Nibribacter ruber]
MHLLSLLSVFSLLWQTLAWAPAKNTTPAIAPTPFVVAPASQGEDARALEFTENKGQWPKQVRFSAAVPGGRLFLQGNAFVYALQEPLPDTHGQPTTSDNAPLSDASPQRRKGHAYTVTLQGATVGPNVQGQEQAPGVSNFYLGNNPARWGKGARNFRKVTYQNVYTGIDMAWYEKDGQLKYDFLLAPGAKSQSIQVKYEGASRLSLQNGNLVIATTVGQVTEHQPVAYQITNNQRIPVSCQYVLEGQTLRFSFPDGYDQNLPLVIDPVVEFSTFSGSTADNWGYTATYDSQGNMYSGGIADFVGYPTSPGAFQETYMGAWDMAIIKYKTSVSGPAARLYATYLGGGDTESPHSLVVNAQDELLVLGTSSSIDFPTSATAYDRSFNGGVSTSPLGGGGNPIYSNGSDLVITRLSQNGENLLASTFLGGSNNDGLLERFQTASPSLVRNYGDQYRGDIITDAAGNVYIASNTASADFPKPNGLNFAFAGGTNDAVVVKLSPDLSSLVWSNLYGGTGTDAAYSIQLDKALNVYVAGGTTSLLVPGAGLGLHPSTRGVQTGLWRSSTPMAKAWPGPLSWAPLCMTKPISCS